MHHGEVWSYKPPEGHNVCWVSVHQGRLLTPEPIHKGELAVFDESATEILFQAAGETAFVLGSARKHPHDLVLGYYSVHTNAENLHSGEENIRRIGENFPQSKH